MNRRRWLVFGVFSILAIVGPVCETWAQTRQEMLLAKLKEADEGCNRQEYEAAGKLFREVIEATNRAHPRVLYSECLQKRGDLIEAHRQCVRAHERARVAGASAQSKKEEAEALEDEKEARSCVDDLEKRIPKLFVHVSGESAENSSLKLYVNDKPLDSTQWGKPYPMNPGSFRITGVTAGGPLAPMAVTLVEGNVESLQVSIQRPVQWEVHRPSALIGVGIPMVVVGLASLIFGGLQADVAYENSMSMRHVVYASFLGTGGIAMTIGGAAMFATGMRELKSEKQNRSKGAFVLTRMGFGIGGRF